MVVAFVACGAEPVPVGQRFLTEADAPGSKPDPVETRRTPDDLDAFIAAFTPALIDPDRDEMTTVFEDAGFTQAGLQVRFFGETHDTAEGHVFGWFIELGSDDGAGAVLDWLETEAMKPCPHSCATRVSSLEVDGISDARGVHRIATAEDIEAAGTPDQRPLDSYWVGFTVGTIVYTIDLNGPPGSVSEEQALEIARAYHDRLAGDLTGGY
jgi:hypothetical protein